MEKLPYDVKYKVLVIGESGVGKTAMIKVLRGDTFSPNLTATVGIDFERKIYTVDGAAVQLEIWDTAGQERFNSLTKFNFRGAQGIILAYDVTNRQSYQRLTYWLESIDLEFSQSVEPIPVYIVGNKFDLEADRKVTTEEGKRRAGNSLARGFRETSAKDDPKGILRVFEKLTYILTETYNPNMMTSHMTPLEREKNGRSLQTDAKGYIKNAGEGSIKGMSVSSSFSTGSGQNATNATIKLEENEPKKYKHCCKSA